jgi:hypothetical protein
MSSKQAVLSIFLLFVFFLLNGTEVVNNSSTLLWKTQDGSIKVAKLSEVLRITDEGRRFTFKNPRQIKISPDGFIFVSEPEQLLKFDRQGQFEKNFLVKGEGPGELKYFADFAFDGGGVVIGAYMPPKVILKSISGNFKREFRIDTVKPFILLRHAANGKYYFHDNEISFGNMGNIKNGVNIRNHSIVSCGPDGKLNQMDVKFSTRDAVIKQTSENGGVSISMDEISRFMTAFEADQYVYIVHKERYQVNQVDLKTGKITRKFQRPYQPVAYKNKVDIDENDAKLEKIKNRKFYNDISAICIRDGKLMVFTSTLDTEKRVLVDVYDHTGIYTDCFYLKVTGIDRPDDLDRKPLCFDGNFFYTATIDEDDNPVVIKYKIQI